MDSILTWHDQSISVMCPAILSMKKSIDDLTNARQGLYKRPAMNVQKRAGVKLCSGISATGKPT